VKRGIYLPPFGSFGDVNVMVELAVSAEASGWDGFFLWDHIRYEKPVPFVDPWVTMAAIAAATERLRIGALITPLARRRPHKVAREVVTLDHLSGGRAVLGVGLGIDFWGEYSAFDEPAEDDRTRARLLDDGIDKMLRYLDGELLPRPVQQPRLPIWSAVVVPAKRQGPLRRAARLDGVMPWCADGQATPDMISEVLTQIGRADRGYEVVLALDPDADPAPYEAAGLTWALASWWAEDPLDNVRKKIAAGP
jgi:alkanesulfonate monooxygenase SsuD/methylene tetrahydromethanopterin reductase-like flavin-dependent oxidoreductase (luciferase family)